MPPNFHFCFATTAKQQCRQSNNMPFIIRIISTPIFFLSNTGSLKVRQKFYECHQRIKHITFYW